MIKLPDFKAGDTFAMGVEYPQGLTGVTVSCGLWRGGALLVNAMGTNAGLTTSEILVPAATTATWAPGLVTGDVRFTDASGVTTTESFLFNVVGRGA